MARTKVNNERRSNSMTDAIFIKVVSGLIVAGIVTNIGFSARINTRVARLEVQYEEHLRAHNAYRTALEIVEAQMDATRSVEPTLVRTQ